VSGAGLHFYGDEELQEAIEVITSRRLSRYRYGDTLGQSQSKTAIFEQEFASTVGTPHCIAMNSCTSALLAALVGLNIGKGDEVLVPGYTFIATIAAVVYSGAYPVLVEIDDSLTMDPDDLAAKVTPRSRAIIPVHMLGAPCAMDRIMSVAAQHNLAIIEDVAQACGGSFGGRRLGSIGDAGAFSLNVFKTITAGDGGVLTTRSKRLYDAAFAFHDHGYSPFRSAVVDADEMFGLNLRMNELVGAVALAQLRKLDKILAVLRANKQRFAEELLSRVPLNFRRSNDEAGDCGTTISCVFDSAKKADLVAGALGTNTLIYSGKHYYGNMHQLSVLCRPAADGLQVGHSQGHYRKGVLPITDDILARTVNLSVGVKDAYLCTSFGIEPHSTIAEITKVASTFAARTSRIL
jgi:dTDP-4-amino-4,6-dideoxygalactose transaminase